MSDYTLSYTGEEVNGLLNTVNSNHAAWDSISHITDYIVAEGESGIWKWQKYANGVAICRGTFSVTAEINISWGSIYECSALPQQTFPFTFTETPLCIPSYVSGGAWIAGFEISGNGTTTLTPSLALLRGTSAISNPYIIGWFVIGYWK